MTEVASVRTTRDAVSGPGSEPILLRDDRDGVARLTLNRPKAFNALSDAMLDAIQTELDAIAGDPAIRVVAISGRGPAFCAGHDLKEMGGNRNRAALTGLFAKCSRMMVTLTRLPQPVIAVVDGIATAAGCQLVAACDLAVATSASRFATSGIKYGLFCSTPMVAVSRNVPRKAALEMLMTGDFIDAQEALRLGLVNRVVPAEDLETEAGQLVRRLLDKPREALALGKRAFYEQLELGLEAAYARTTEVIVENALGADFEEGLRAFVEKRKPSWDQS